MVDCPVCGKAADGLVRLSPRDQAMASLRVPVPALPDWEGGVCLACQVREGWARADADAADRGAEPEADLLPAAAGGGLDGAVPVEPFAVARRANLPALERVAERMPDFAPRAEESGQLDLPLPGDVAMPWLIQMFHRAIGRSHGGRGAPPHLHLAVGALMHLGIAERDGTARAMRFQFEDVNGWVHGGGRRVAIQRERDLKGLRQALDRARALGVIEAKGTSLQFLSLSFSVSRNLVEFIVRVPQVAARGFGVDWGLLCAMRTKSFPLYKAYMAACYILDRSARNGHPQTAEIAQAVVGADGRPVRGQGGVPVRDPAEMAPNPNLRFVKAYSSNELALMMGYDFGRAVTSKANRWRALGSFRTLAEMGIIDFVEPEHTERGGYRILGPQRSG